MQKAGKPRKQYTVVDFILNEGFQQWVKYPEDPLLSEEWNTFFQDNPHKKSMADEARNMVLQLTSAKREVPAEEEVAELWRDIKKSVLPAPFPKRVKVPFFRIWQKVAAILTGLLMIAGGIYVYNDYIRPDRHITASQGRQTIVLPDRSTVILNKDARIRYARNWNGNGPREVWLKGEAFFEVKHLAENEAQPEPGNLFIVHAGGMDIQVLGTSFNVNTTDQSTNVVLSTGKVKIDFTDNHASMPGQRPVVMKPGEMITYSKKQRKVMKTRVRPDIYSSWQNGELNLQDTPFSEILRWLELTYHCKVSYPDTAFLSRELSGTIPLDDRELVLQAIATTLNMKVESDEDEIIFKR